MKVVTNPSQIHIASPKNFSAFPAFVGQPPQPPQPPQAPRRAPIMHAADRFKQQVGLAALKWFPGVLICRGLHGNVHNIDITPMYGIPRYIPTHTITIQTRQTNNAWIPPCWVTYSNERRVAAISPDYSRLSPVFHRYLHIFTRWARCACLGRLAWMHLE